MGYYNYLCGLLEPLGLYDLENGAGAAELSGIGAELDRVFDVLEEHGREVISLTANGYGLENLEALFPYRPSYVTMEDRRRAVTALLRIRNGYFTLEALCDTLGGCGINAAVCESDAPMTVEVSFPDNLGIPDDIVRLKQKIEQILPCHLGVVYRYIYAEWGEIMANISSWQNLQESCGSWKELEIYK
jgi:hypothetical protein